MPCPRIGALFCLGWMPINASSDGGCSPACFAADHADRTAQAIRADKQRRARLFGGSCDLRNPLEDHRVWTTQRREDELAGRGHSEVQHEL